jgi:tetratricopeptide (TPR) repeat protein
MKVTEGCWRITNGSEIAMIEQILPTFLPKLANLSKQPSKHLSTIAELTTHGYLLASLVALDQFNLSAMDAYSRLAVEYGTQHSELTRNYDLRAAALKQQATMFQMAKNPEQALQTYRSVLPFINQIAPLLQSRIYQGLARTSAQCGLEKEATAYLAHSQETFPCDFEADPSFLYADSGFSVLAMYQGLTHLDMDQPQKAWEAFSQVVYSDSKDLAPKITIGKLTHLEFVNLLGTAAIALRDQERSQAYLETAVSIARGLKSQWGRSEARDVYKQMRLVWPGDPRVKSLGQIFIDEL